MAKTKIITIPIAVNNGTAANTALSFTKSLKSGDSSFKKVKGFGLAVQSDGGVDFDVQLEPVAGKPLIDYVSKEYLRIGANTKPDERLLSVEFDIPNEDTVVVIRPRANLTSNMVCQAIFLLEQ